MNPLNEIQKSKSDGDWDRAMSLFLQELEKLSKSNDPQDSFVTNILLDGSDLILDWARHKFHQGDFESIAPDAKKLINQCAHWGSIGWIVRRRLDLIQLLAVEPSDFEQELRRKIKSFVDLYKGHNGWNWNKLPLVNEFDALNKPQPSDLKNGPSFLSHMPERYRALFVEIAGKAVSNDEGVTDIVGWTHPGILMAGELIAHLETARNKTAVDSQRPTEHTVHQWIMFAAETLDRPMGVLARLKVERLAGPGRGLLFPDPQYMAYHRMSAVFSTSLQRAWLAVWNHRWNRVAGNDYRWQVDLFEALQDEQLALSQQPTMDGPSAEAAIACALIAAEKGEDLDRNTSISATFDDQIAPQLKLGTIGALDSKTLSGRLRKKKIFNVIVCNLQSETDLDFGTEQAPIKVENLDSAYQEATQFARITRHVKASLAKRAQANIDEFCGPEIPEDGWEQLGRNYVMSPVAERLPTENAADGRLPEPRKLTGAERKAFELGKWKPERLSLEDPVRLRIFAKSGMGKTIQLTAMERAIALDKSTIVPIRIGKASGHREIRPSSKNAMGLISLSDIAWSSDRDQTLKLILQRHLESHLPAEVRSESEQSTALKWLDRLARSGDLFFLLDALDQTASRLDGLANFLATVGDCVVVAAGRLESLANQKELFENERWISLDLLPLKTAHQRDFLGKRQAEKLIPKEDRLFAWSEPDERRRHQWKELLGTPMLLNDLASEPDKEGVSQLDGISNRYQLYCRAIPRLFGKGIRSDESVADVDETKSDYEEKLMVIAAEMVKRHHFDVMEGNVWKEVQQLLGEADVDALVQAALFNKHRIIERMELQTIDDPKIKISVGYDWRHRSYQEFFAAKELAKQWKSDQESVAQILFDVHACIDDHGQFRKWKMFDAATETYDEKFRNLPADWNQTLRFLLAASEFESRNSIALKLIELGNPWVVYEASLSDQLYFDPRISGLVRKLVEHNFIFDYEVNYSDSRFQQFDSEVQELDLGEDWKASFLDRKTRDAGTLWGYRQLFDADDFWPNENYPNISWRSCDPIEALINNSRWYQIPDLQLQIADFPITNIEFEAFCPSHRPPRDFQVQSV